MKKIFVFILLFFLICPIDSFSQDKPHKSVKRAKIETISKRRAKSKTAPKNKKDQKRRQKARIENNKPEKINTFRKK
jgi:Na+-transporting methylmalonyl-CoA/oxaloacetate decarboxylase gamma subunit